jgi:hypothetical protein
MVYIIIVNPSHRNHAPPISKCHKAGEGKVAIRMFQKILEQGGEWSLGIHVLLAI